MARVRPGLATWTAILFVLVAAAAVVLYDQGRLRAWMPNVAVSALTIAITVTLINWIVGREAQNRVRSRVDWAHRLMGEAMERFAEAVVYDYAHALQADGKPIPETAGLMIGLWLADYEQDAHVLQLSRSFGGNEIPLLVKEADTLTKRLEESRARDLDILEPDLVQAIDRFRATVLRAVERCESIWQSKDPERTHQEAAHSVVEEAQNLVRVFSGCHCSHEPCVGGGLRQLVTERMEAHRS